MGLIEILWTATGVVVPLLLGTAWAMVGLTPPEFLVARGSVILAALIFSGVSLFWVSTADWSLGTRSIIAILLGAMAFVVFGEAIRWINGREVQAAPAAQCATDYAYGLVFEKLEPSLDVRNQDNALEIRPRFKNASGAPLKFHIERIEQDIEGVHVTTPVNEIILAKDQSLPIYLNRGFSLKQLEGFKDRSLGSMEFDIVYGHPDSAPTRRATKKVRLDLFKSLKKGKLDAVGVNWTILSEKDEPIAR